jgi:peptidoglycan-associated lipoprotein
MIMIKKISVALLAILFLSGCSSSRKVSISSSEAESSLVADFEKNVGDRVLFALDKSDLSGNSKAQLEKQANWLKSHPSVKATIEGHCDERGTREYNLALGERRAESVKRFLSTKGVEAERLDTISYGKEKPAVIGNNEDAWKQNRRAVTAIK